MEDESKEIMDAVVVKKRTAAQMLFDKQEELRLIEVNKQKYYAKVKALFIERFTKKLLDPKTTIPIYFPMTETEPSVVDIELCRQIVGECISDPDNILECSLTYDKRGVKIDFREKTEPNFKGCSLC